MSQQGPPQDALRKLPVFQTVAEANAMVFGSLPSLAKAAALPFVMSLGISFMAQGTPFSPAWSLMLGLLGLIPDTYFGVAWHRYVLLGAKRAAPTTLPPIAPRHWRFLGYAVVMLMITGLPGLGLRSAVQPLYEVQGQPAPELVTEVFGNMLPFLALLIFAFVLMLRLYFVFPAVAVDERYGLADSWRHTRGQALRLLLGQLILVIPVAIVIYMAAGALTGGTPGEPSLAALIVTMMLFYVGMGLVFAFISIAFRECTGWIPAAQAGPPGLIGGEEEEQEG